MIALGEGPARIRAGAITDTMRKARAHVVRGTRLDPRKQASQYRAQANGFDRRAVFLTEDGNTAGARAATVEAERLRTLADETEGAKLNA